MGKKILNNPEEAKAELKSQFAEISDWVTADMRGEVCEKLNVSMKTTYLYTNGSALDNPSPDLEKAAGILAALKPMVAKRKAQINAAIDLPAAMATANTNE